MTSNIGTKVVKDFGGGIGFTTKSKQETQEQSIKDTLEKELKKKFAPEFINRLEEIIYFRDLNKEDILQIVDLELNKTLSRSKEIGYELTITDSLKEHLVEVGYDVEYGARPLKRAIQKWVDDSVTEFIIDNNLKSGQNLTLDYNKEENKTEVLLEPKDKKTTKKRKEK